MSGPEALLSNRNQRDPEVVFWPSCVLEAWFTKAKQIHRVSRDDYVAHTGNFTNHRLAKKLASALEVAAPRSRRSFLGSPRPKIAYYRCLLNKRPSRPYECIGFGAMDVTKPYKFIWFGDIHGPKPYEKVGGFAPHLFQWVLR